MTTITRDPNRLFELLPSLYRVVDTEHGDELRALLALITRQADDIHEGTQQLWDDFFIETCQRWVVPYIGDLVGNIPLHDLDPRLSSATAESLFKDLAGPDLRPPGAIRLRADVAKTIYYRRRKATPPMLEELARDVTGWHSHVVEFFTLLRWNQHLEHLRFESPACPDLRQIDTGDRVGGPWDSSPHTVDVRKINQWDGWYNIPNIGFFLWRLHAFRLRQTKPRAIGGTTWRLTFSPLGQDIPLFSAGRREPGESLMATELTVEAPIRSAAFFDDLRGVPGQPTPGPVTGYYGDPTVTDASLGVFADGVALPAGEVTCMNLDKWSVFAQQNGTVVGIDPSRGRLLIPKGRANQAITVSYYYGLSAPMGGGEYDRAKWLVSSPPPIPVGGGGTALDDAIKNRVSAPATVIQITDDLTYDIVTDITLAAAESLTIQADNGVRPHLRLANGEIAIDTAGPGASLTLGGLLVEGGLRVKGDLDTFRLLHSTLVPGRSDELEIVGPSGPSLIVDPGPANALINTRLEVQVAFSITGALRMPSHSTKLWLLDSIVHGILKAGGPTVAAVSDAAGGAGPPAYVERCTLFGNSHFLKLDLGSESIFTGPVVVEQEQQGCVRFSYVPPGSATPQQYRCQPELEIRLETEQRKNEAAKTGIPLPPGWDTAISDAVGEWLVPTFEATGYGRPEYAQLRRTCPIQIRTGAEDGSEMGVFCFLKQPAREANLRLRLDEYLPVGLEAGLIYVT